jgi:hypothetical protein
MICQDEVIKNSSATAIWPPLFMISKPRLARQMRPWQWPVVNLMTWSSQTSHYKLEMMTWWLRLMHFIITAMSCKVRIVIWTLSWNDLFRQMSRLGRPWIAETELRLCARKLNTKCSSHIKNSNELVQFVTTITITTFEACKVICYCCIRNEKLSIIVFKLLHTIIILIFI